MPIRKIFDSPLNQQFLICILVYSFLHIFSREFLLARLELTSIHIFVLLSFLHIQSIQVIAKYLERKTLYGLLGMPLLVVILIIMTGVLKQDVEMPIMVLILLTLLGIVWYNPRSVMTGLEAMIRISVSLASFVLLLCGYSLGYTSIKNHLFLLAVLMLLGWFYYPAKVLYRKYWLAVSAAMVNQYMVVRAFVAKRAKQLWFAAKVVMFISILSVFFIYAYLSGIVVVFITSVINSIVAIKDGLLALIKIGLFLLSYANIKRIAVQNYVLNLLGVIFCACKNFIQRIVPEFMTDLCVAIVFKVIELCDCVVNYIKFKKASLAKRYERCKQIMADKYLVFCKRLATMIEHVNAKWYELCEKVKAYYRSAKDWCIDKCSQLYSICVTSSNYCYSCFRQLRAFFKRQQVQTHIINALLLLLGLLIIIKNQNYSVVPLYVVFYVVTIKGLRSILAEWSAIKIKLFVSGLILSSLWMVFNKSFGASYLLMEYALAVNCMACALVFLCQKKSTSPVDRIANLISLKVILAVVCCWAFLDLRTVMSTLFYFVGVMSLVGIWAIDVHSALYRFWHLMLRNITCDDKKDKTYKIMSTSFIFYAICAGIMRVTFRDLVLLWSLVGIVLIVWAECVAVLRTLKIKEPV